MATPTFSDLSFGPHHFGGKRAVQSFDNGYSASVVQFPGSYGYEEGLYELAVMHGGKLAYDTPVTNDVLGHLSEEDVTKALADIAALPERAAQAA